MTGNYIQNKNLGELLGGPVVKTWSFHWGGQGSIPGGGTKIPQAVWETGHISSHLGVNIREGNGTPLQ